MKIHNQPSFQPINVTFETEAEWRVFLAILGNHTSISKCLFNAETDNEESVIKKMNILEIQATLDRMITYEVWRKAKDALSND